MNRLTLIVVVLLVLLTAAMKSAAHAESWNENSPFFGDLSSDPANPDPISLVHGLNFITGSVGDGDIDVIKFTMSTDHHLETLILGDYVGPSMSFMGIQSGAVWTAGTGADVNPASLLGWTHFGTAAPLGARVNDDLLDDLGTPKMGSTGFTRPMWPQIFTMLLQDTGATVNYSIRFYLFYNGDFNHDTLVTAADLPVWSGDFGLNAASTADPDADSDGADFLIWQQALDQPFGPVRSTPEPSGVALGLIAAGALGVTRRRSTAAHRR